MADFPRLFLTKQLGALCVSSAAFFLGCGGDDSDPRPMRGTSVAQGRDPFSCSAAEGYELSIIQDFEKGIATDFYTNADGTEGSAVEPPLGSKSPAASDIEGGRCGTSLRAFRMTGRNLRRWGMVFGFNFRGGARDLTAWDGISFWARRGSGSGRSLFFSVFDPDTESSGGNCDSESERIEEKCDAYGVGIGLSEEWRFFAIPFSALRQRGFGVPTDELRLDQILGLNWAADRGDWDVWVDDVALYRASDETGY